MLITYNPGNVPSGSGNAGAGAIMFCPKCGIRLQDDTAFVCPKCGACLRFGAAFGQSKGFLDFPLHYLVYLVLLFVSLHLLDLTLDSMGYHFNYNWTLLFVAAGFLIVYNRYHTVKEMKSRQDDRDRPVIPGDERKQLSLFWYISLLLVFTNPGLFLIGLFCNSDSNPKWRGIILLLMILLLFLLVICSRKIRHLSIQSGKIG
jgi:hypothetical protein